MVRLCELWERTSERSGKVYLSGYWGDLSIVAFAKEREHPKRPGEIVTVWTIFAEERDSARRPGGGR
jgi:hypothetical protein